MRTHRPHLDIMPLDNRMHPHKPRPSPIRDIEPFPTQHPTVRIRPSRTHEDSFDAGVSPEILREGFFHGCPSFPLSCHLGISVVAGVDVELEVVFPGGREGEGGDGVEWVRGGYVDCWEGGRERGVGGEEGEVED